MDEDGLLLELQKLVMSDLLWLTKANVIAHYFIPAFDEFGYDVRLSVTGTNQDVVLEYYNRIIGHERANTRIH
jgi:hypothetical protein